MLDDLVVYLRLSGFTPQSIDSLGRDLPRWVRRLQARGVTAIPPLAAGTTSMEQARAHNEISVLISEAARSSRVRHGVSEPRSSTARRSDIGHHLRNLAGVRPYKD